MQARLPSVPVGGPILPMTVALLTATVLAGCGGGASSATTAGDASTAARSTSPTTPAATPTATHAKVAAKDPTGAPAGTDSTGTTTGDGATPHGIKPEERLGKTGFLAHSGLGFAAFHEYIFEPQRTHVFSHPGAAQRAALAKGVVAAQYAEREIAAAASAAASGGQVPQLATPLRAVSHRMQAIAAAMKAGTVDAAAITAAGHEIDEISLTAFHAGQRIQEVPPKLP